ncbi:lasso RiPP family leader peptide-containing protein [Amycolatopsis sp. YIM 10]|uniref:Uncharacterized protein n=1 Tax=Amycolatopsis sp. YIM 10 TaxID=2653857 RepID=A0ACD6BAC4_9PSEU|nr:lasso RiPP family leader peptide-containing protein [Amycolatopsis sp. YIM 10]QFU91026.1 hypothetical protein YIM_29270 [Amycolatopsis sp. YIM 10]
MAESPPSEKELVFVNNESTVFEAPALIEVGDFDKVTLGSRGWGFEPGVRCLIWCD